MIEFVAFGLLFLIVVVGFFVIQELSSEVNALWQHVNLLRAEISRLEKNSHNS
jgi:hypothetical protein